MVFGLLAMAQGYIAASDYPPEALKQHHEGIVEVELVVDPTGRLANCAVTHSTRWPELDATTCELFKQRAKYAPAQDNHGRKLGYVYRMRINWLLDPKHASSVASPPLDQLHVNAALDPSKKSIVAMSVIVSATGAILTCNVNDLITKDSALKTVDVVDQACSDFARLGKHDVMMDSDGNPMVYAREQRFQLVGTVQR